MTAFTLAHLSDPHIPPLPTPQLRELLGKRVLGYLNWIRNRHTIHRRDVLDALVADMLAQQPDHIAVTGDLVNLALPAEFAPARAWLERLGPPDRVSLVPGNHDAYVAATRHLAADVWGDYMGGDNAGGADGFPYLRRRGPLALIGVSTAVPTAPFMATGTLGTAQIAALDRMLAGLEGETLFRVLLIHHPLRSTHSHKRLTDSTELQSVLKRHGVELVLHGHDHVHSTIWVAGPRGKIPVVGVPSASSIAHGEYPAAAYNLFSIEHDGHAWHCAQSVRGVVGSKGILDIRQVKIF